MLNVIASFLSSVYPNPFHIQSIFPESSSCSLAAQDIVWTSNFIPNLLQTSWAKSMSKPTNSLFSFLYPIGGKLSSIPNTNVLSSSLLFLLNVIATPIIAITNITPTIIKIFLLISFTSIVNLIRFTPLVILKTFLLKCRDQF